MHYLQTQRLLLAKQLLTDTRAAGDAGGAGQRLSPACAASTPPSPTRYRLNPTRAARATPIAATRSAGRAVTCGWATGRRTTSTACCASSRSARSPASRRSSGQACAARCALDTAASARAAGSPRRFVPERARDAAARSRRRCAGASARWSQRVRAGARPRRRARSRSMRRWHGAARRGAGLRVPGSVDGFELAVRVGARPAGHGGRGAHAGAPPGRALRRRRSRRRSPTLHAPVPVTASARRSRSREAIGKLGIVRQRVRRAAGAGARGGPRAASRCTAARRSPPRSTRCARCPASANGRCS